MNAVIIVYVSRNYRVVLTVSTVVPLYSICYAYYILYR